METPGIVSKAPKSCSQKVPFICLDSLNTMSRAAVKLRMSIALEDSEQVMGREANHCRLLGGQATSSVAVCSTTLVSVAAKSSYHRKRDTLERQLD